MALLSPTFVFSGSSKKHFLSRRLVLGAGPERGAGRLCRRAVPDDKKKGAQVEREQAEEWGGIWKWGASGRPPGFWPG